ASNTPDYFSLPRPNRLDQEPNPFEQSFASGSTSTNNGDPLATPKAILPPVTAMTSPAPLLGGSGSYNWGPNSLRSGPLSPAMLQGPTNPNSLGFDTHLRTGLTPNESGIRSGLTPGGSGSMFPAPSPSTSQLFFGGATPGTMEFQKTALSAARKSAHPQPPLIPPQSNELKSEDNVSHINSSHDQSKSRQPSDPFNADPAHNAANGLYLLAQMGGGSGPNPYPQSHMSSGIPPNATNMDSTSRAVSSSIVSNGVRGVSEMSNNRSDSSEEPENGMSTRKGRSTRGKSSTANTGKRKNDGGSDGKSATNKKSKNARLALSGSDDGEMEDYDDDGQNDTRKDGKKMTDEEKRKNFLERNRVAALKCRQRKKQWLANLQAKVEMYGTENDALNATVQSLREEIVSLKTLLLAHKDCPVARANGVQLDIASLAAGTNDYGHVQMMQPYPGMMMHQQPQGERRYS
ncbi:Aft1 HRA domain-containing protein, partial [Trichophaea hybrida]